MRALTSVSTILFIVLVFSACKSHKPTETPKNSNEDKTGYFVVGEGGGFAGTYEQYRVHQEGTVEVFDFKSNTYVLLTKVNEKDLAAFFTQIDELNLTEVEMNMPGNMSQYIEIDYNGLNHYRIVWPKDGKSIRHDILSFFESSFYYCKGLAKKDN